LGKPEVAALEMKRGLRLRVLGVLRVRKKGPEGIGKSESKVLVIGKG
jgi:hypothetical protein